MNKIWNRNELNFNQEFLVRLTNYYTKINGSICTNIIRCYYFINTYMFYTILHRSTYTLFFFVKLVFSCPGIYSILVVGENVRCKILHIYGSAQILTFTHQKYCQCSIIYFSCKPWEVETGFIYRSFGWYALPFFLICCQEDELIQH